MPRPVHTDISSKHLPKRKGVCQHISFQFAQNLVIEIPAVPLHINISKMPTLFA